MFTRFEQRPPGGSLYIDTTDGLKEYASLEVYYAQRYAGGEPISSFAWSKEPEWVRSRGGPVAIYQFGPENGTQVLSFHGNPGTGRGANPAESILEEADIRLITFDAPGFGDTPLIPSEDPAFVVAGNVARDIIDELGYREVGVLARSGGVPRSLGFAALHPERVSGMVLIAGLAPPEANIDWQQGMTAHNHTIFDSIENNNPAITELVETARKIQEYEPYLYNKIRPDVGALDEVLFEMHPDLPQCIAASMREGVRNGAAGWVQSVVALRQPWGFDLNDIKAPTRIVHGTFDPFAGIEHARWLQKNIENAELEEIKFGGHFTNWRHIERHLRFLKTSHAQWQAAEMGKGALASSP